MEEGIVEFIFQVLYELDYELDECTVVCKIRNKNHV